MEIPLFLSGNFGELRSNHFHSGIDFKTQGVTGIPVKAVQDGWELAKKAIQNDEYNLVILDEANIAIDLELIDVDEVVEVLKLKPEEMEIVLTGRNAHPKIINTAHLVSKIEPVKHYWDTGVVARKGIEY